jgi:hypothetical protein
MGGIGTKESPPSGYPYPDYDPARWGMEFGHEIGHSGMKQTNPFYDFTSKLRSPLDYKEGGAEETLSRLHDYMYGNYKEPFWGSGASSFLRQRGYIEPNEPGQMHYNVDFTPKAYDAIRNSNLKDWQKGVMSLGPTTSRGQIARGHTPDQVRAQGEAYMDPNRGNYQAPTMSQQGMRDEATRTGGTVNPHEATRTFSRGPHDYQAGGSVNPHEETTRAAREWNTGERPTRPRDGVQPPRPWGEPWRHDPDREWTPPKGEPYRPNPEWEGKPYPVAPMGQASSDWNNSGVMLAMNNNPAVKRAKGIYNQADPYTPDIDWNEKTLGYDFNLPLWGGNLGFEFDYDIDDENYGAGINWSIGG